MALFFSTTSKKKNKNVEIDYTWLSRTALLKFALLLAFFFQLKLLNQATVLTSTSIVDSLDEDANNNPSSNVIDNKKNDKKYRNCPFRDSSIVESIYVYPSPGDVDWEGDILSNFTRVKNESVIEEYPWIANDLYCKAAGIGPYDITSQMVQYNTELMVRDILTHPDSCLRTYDPEKATLFYVPYLPAAEYHNGTVYNDFSQSKYGKALIDVITENKFEAWEKEFGLTSKYWKRRRGADHIMVYSEPMHGLWHPRGRRGNFHFLRSQYQTYSPIAISVELSATFINMYPMCARSNILMPYPNTNGKWFNGKLDNEIVTLMAKSGIQKISDSSGAIESEVKLEQQEAQERRLELSSKSASTHIDDGNLDRNETSNITAPLRVIGYFYKGGNHGSCRKLRRSMYDDFQCSPSGRFIKKHKMDTNYAYAYRQATFCPAPGGDSPSAKRNFDALLAGCIPVVLSKDFVWPFTAEFDRSAIGGDNRYRNESIISNGKIAPLNPRDFSIQLQAIDHEDPKFDLKTCKLLSEDDNSTDHHEQNPDLQSVLEAVSPEELERLRRGVAQAAYTYSYYRKRPDLPDNPLKEGVLPDGGAAHMLVRALEERSYGALWGACERELKDKNILNDDVNSFKC